MIARDTIKAVFTSNSPFLHRGPWLLASKPWAAGSGMNAKVHESPDRQRTRTSAVQAFPAGNCFPTASALSVPTTYRHKRVISTGGSASTYRPDNSTSLVTQGTLQRDSTTPAMWACNPLLLFFGGAAPQGGCQRAGVETRKASENTKSQTGGAFRLSDSTYTIAHSVGYLAQFVNFIFVP